MVWCSYCGKDQIAERDEINGFTCCTGCGRVLDDNVYSSEPTFCKGSAGQSQLSGNIVRAGQYSTYARIGSDPGAVQGYHSDSHERTLERGRNEIKEIADSLSISGRDDAVGAAHRLYVLAVEKSFTKGRRTQQVAASCLYIVCRQDNKPYLLIDFSDSLQINVYVLGAVFLQLCRLLRLEQHSMLQKPVDPSLFIHRFTDRLLGMMGGSSGKKHHAIANTALRIVASMKRDWIQTGRRPSGICGAALFISAHIHGFECTKGDVVSVVHICEATLTRRLLEFGSTESGSLTPEEFEIKAKEMELQTQTAVEPCVNIDSNGQRAITEILCEHKDLGATHYAHGLCRSCYDEFIKVSGGIQGGSAPPAFQRAERKRLEAERQKLQKFLLEEPEEEVLPRKGKRKQIEEADTTFQEDVAALGSLCKELDGVPGDDEMLSRYLSKPRMKMDLNQLGMSSEDIQELAAACQNPRQELDGCNGTVDSCVTESMKFMTASQLDTEDESHNLKAPDLDMDNETLSDIDDDEVTAYLNNEDEVRLKTIIWTEMNKEYIEELEAKEAAIRASEAAQAAALSAVSSSSTAAEIAAAAAAAVTNSKKTRKQKRNDNANKVPAESAAEAARQMLESKRLGSKLNLGVLEKLFDGKEETPKDVQLSTESPESAKKARAVHWADEKHLHDNVEPKSKDEDVVDDTDGEELLNEDDGDGSYSHVYEQQEEDDYEEY